MSQRIEGIYSLVTRPALYARFQNALGGESARRRYVREWVRSTTDSDVLDVGCGPGSLLPCIAWRSYVGVDLNPAHVETARARGFSNTEFYAGPAEEVIPTIDRTFNAIFSIGFLHHLDDEKVNFLIKCLTDRLRSSGSIYLLEPVIVERQNLIAKLMKRIDSGRHIRNQIEYEEIFNKSGFELKTRLTNDLLRIPYNHLWMRLVKW